MIRIKRDIDEPRELKRTGKKRLEKALDAFENFGSSSKEFKDTLKEGYGTYATKERLYLAQQKKCAWCERRTDFSSNPVEHYRPKNSAKRHLPDEKPEIIDAEHYWWLAWTWTNLFFSCVRCNDQGHKGNYFPMKTGTKPVPHLSKPIARPLPPSAFDTSSEQPLLLDPATNIDPLDHIQWKATDESPPRELWIWTPDGLTEIGKATIRILKLEELSEEVGVHLKTCVLPSIEEIEKHFNAKPKRLKDARERWNKLLLNTLSPESKLSAATWCALEIWMPASKRSKNGLADPRRPGS